MGDTGKNPRWEEPETRWALIPPQQGCHSLMPYPKAVHNFMPSKHFIKPSTGETIYTKHKCSFVFLAPCLSTGVIALRVREWESTCRQREWGSFPGISDASLGARSSSPRALRLLWGRPESTTMPGTWWLHHTVTGVNIPRVRLQTRPLVNFCWLSLKTKCD